MGLVLCFCRNNNIQKQNNENIISPPNIVSSPIQQENEKCIGVWVSYIDLEIDHAKDIEVAFKNKFDNIIKKAKEFSVNNIFVHVRSHCDSLYPSEIFPWSHLLTGIQGKEPGFDPLAYMINSSHENNIKFHAWINPLRVKTCTFPKEISSNSPFYKFSSDKFIYHRDGICLNPAYEDTRDIVLKGVIEIVKNYDVDGIHFDDYFYPDPDTLTAKDMAYKSYIENSQKKTSLIKWRKDCVNTLIKQVYEGIKSINPRVEFGISPPGNPKKCESAGIDIHTLSCEGYLDYVCPQIYWSTDYPLMPFEKTALLWKDMFKTSKVKLYGGLALYKAGTDLDDGTWKNSNSILTQELCILKSLDYQGVMLYSWKHLNSTNQEIINLNSSLKNNGF